MGMVRDGQARFSANREGASAPLSPQEALQPLLDELDAIHQLLDARGIELLVLLVNHQEMDGTFSPGEKEYNAIVTAHGKQEGIAVFDPIPHFEAVDAEAPIFRIGGDHHWSARAQALVAKELSTLLRQQTRYRDSWPTNGQWGMAIQ